jgi:uncharacterized oxidoreductase
MQADHHVALITGGGSGIGRAIAGELAARGNTVVVAGRSAERLERTVEALTPSHGVHALRCDISKESDVRAALSHIESRFGGLTMLVNNAGVLHNYDLTDDSTAAAKIEEEVTTNLLAPLRLTSLALPLLLREPAAAIVNISSVLAYAGTPTAPVYGATKAGLHSFSRSLRTRLAGTPVRVFEVLPAVVDTEMTDRLDVAKIGPDVVARAFIDALDRDTYEVRVGQANAAYRLSRISLRAAEKAVQRAMTPRMTGAVGVP